MSQSNETMPRQQLIFTDEPHLALQEVVDRIKPDKVIFLADENTEQHAITLKMKLGRVSPLLAVESGEDNKDMVSLDFLWTSLAAEGATRHSLLVNVGGGVVCDLGGFAAATYMRGMPFVNCPTTVLAAVDAAIGGKTGINHCGLKNLAGAFAMPQATIVGERFLATLPLEQRKAGYAEMLKHAMISGEEDFNRLLTPPREFRPSLATLRESAEVKLAIVEEDPNERGRRKILNWGHTAAHAFESLAMEQDYEVEHGFAVAWGMVVESVLSHMILQFPSAHLYSLARFVREHYEACDITCDDYPSLIDFMRHDKKNRDGEIRCTLLRALGEPEINVSVTDDQITAALDIYRDLMGI